MNAINIPQREKPGKKKATRLGSPHATEFSDPIGHRSSGCFAVHRSQRWLRSHIATQRGTSTFPVRKRITPPPILFWRRRSSVSKVGKHPHGFHSAYGHKSDPTTNGGPKDRDERHEIQLVDT